MKKPNTMRRRLVLFALLGTLAILLGFFSVPADQVAQWIQSGGYPVMVLVTVGWVVSLLAGWRLWRRRLGPRSAVGAGRSRRIRRTAGIVVGIAALGGFMHAHFPHQFKILNDEVALAGTAMAMHKTRDVFVPIQAVYLEGALRLETGYIDKRPFFFPFLASLLHDATGYRMGNTILLNALLTPLLLGLVLLAGRAAGGHRGGWIALWLLVSLPLLGQNVTSGGFEILNLILILAVVVLGGLYLRSPRLETLLPLVYTTVALAYTRYESILFVVPVGLIILLGWWRSGRVVLPAMVFAVPLLLVPIPWLMRSVQSNYAAFFQLADLKVETAFSFAYFGDNIASATRFFLHSGGVYLNSAPLAGVGILGMVAFAVSMLGRLVRREPVRPMEVSLGLIGLFVLANFLLLQCYHWGRAEDPVVARLTLPLQAIFALAAAWLAGAVARRWRPFRNGALAFAVAAAVYVAPPASSNHHLERVLFPILRQQAIEDFVRGQPTKDILVLADNPLNFIIGEIYAMPISLANEQPELIRRYLDGRLVSAVYVAREFHQTEDRPDGYDRATRLSERFDVELVEERFRQPGQRWQLYRLRAVLPPPAAGAIADP